MIDLNELSMQEVGRRLKQAREDAGVRQDDAAQVINVSRPTLVAIEQGSRRIKMKELQILASRYGISANALLRREAVYTDFLPRFRKGHDTDDSDTNLAIECFNDLIRADVELQNVLGIPERRNYPPEHGISVGDVEALAEKNAQLLRNHLGLGTSPIPDIFSIIEFGLGIRLYQRQLPSKIAGLFTYDDTVGACILLNANHPLQRRVQSAGHELGHFDGTRSNPEVLEINEKFSSREERYADTFGREFLTPSKPFTEHFQELRRMCATDRLSRDLVILLADRFGISREACVRRLIELGLAKKSSWDYFELKGGITDDDVKKTLGESALRNDPAKDDARRPISRRMSLMAHAAWKRELMSEGQLSELLKISRIELRKIVDSFELEDDEAHELLKLSD